MSGTVDIAGDPEHTRISLAFDTWVDYRGVYRRQRDLVYAWFTTNLTVPGTEQGGKHMTAQHTTHHGCVRRPAIDWDISRRRGSRIRPARRRWVWTTAAGIGGYWTLV